MNKLIIDQLRKIVKTGKVSTDINLKNLNTMKLGGSGSVLVEIKQTEEMIDLYKFLERKGISYLLIGGGSNIVFSDHGYMGVLIKIASSDFNVIKEESEKMIVKFSAGYSSHLAAVKSMEMSYSGLEGLYGLPGTIGGAIYMNSKWPEGNYQVSDNLLEVEFIDHHGKYRVMKSKEIKFKYGYSIFQSIPCVLLSGTFLLKKKKKSEIETTSRDVLVYRKETQPVAVFTAGCIFKNISDTIRKEKGLPTNSAGYLIDKSGLKNSRIGGMVISNIHANFFINESKATSKDYLELVKLVKETVFANFKVKLKEEVMYID
jgi:UDP-N-acetylenolpyruvoylglucosamine reductase